MSPEQAAKIFDEFVQADLSTTRKYGGTGLGLAICRRFCQMMGGDIRVESSSGAGSTFIAYMPRQVADQAVIVASAGNKVASQSTRSVESEAPLILVIDDDEVARELMQHYLAEQHFQVATASNGMDGLQMARDLMPNVIVLDIMMPQVDGWTVLSTLKTDPDLGHIPVIMLSMVNDRRTGYALGASDYLVKPVQPSHLATVLNKYRPRLLDQESSILVVEDEPNTRLMIRDILEQQGFVVTEAENGLAGLLRVKERRPSMILLDLMMPEMDGFTFLDALRQMENMQEIPVVVVTAMDLTPDDRERLEGSIERIIQKGAYTPEKLLETIHLLVQEHLA
jgi:CheY-like chemotaxis protein